MVRYRRTVEEWRQAWVWRARAAKRPPGEARSAGFAKQIAAALEMSQLNGRLARAVHLLQAFDRLLQVR